MFFYEDLRKKSKRGIFLSLSLFFVQILSFAIKQTRKLSESIDRAKREVFLSRPFARITKRRRERERESSGGGGDQLSLSLPLSLSFSFLFFSLPQTKKNKIKRSHGGGKDFLPSSFAPFCASSLSFSLSLFPFCAKKVGAHARRRRRRRRRRRERVYTRARSIHRHDRR